MHHGLDPLGMAFQLIEQFFRRPEVGDGGFGEIANDGELMTPYIVNRTLTADLEEVSTTKPKSYGTAMSKETAAYMQDMMIADVESGTGYRAAIDGVDVAGKTGTAEIASGVLPHAWFAAFAPADDPEIAVVVLLENDPGDGGSSAAPVAREIIQAKLKPEVFFAD